MAAAGAEQEDVLSRVSSAHDSSVSDSWLSSPSASCSPQLTPWLLSETRLVQRVAEDVSLKIQIVSKFFQFVPLQQFIIVPVILVVPLLLRRGFDETHRHLLLLLLLVRAGPSLRIDYPRELEERTTTNMKWQSEFVDMQIPRWRQKKTFLCLGRFRYISASEAYKKYADDDHQFQTLKYRLQCFTSQVVSLCFHSPLWSSICEERRTPPPPPPPQLSPDSGNRFTLEHFAFSGCSNFWFKIPQIRIEWRFCLWSPTICQSRGTCQIFTLIFNGF